MTEHQEAIKPKILIGVGAAMKAKIMLWTFLFLLSGWLPTMNPLGISPLAEAGEQSGLKSGKGEILIINSYHPGYAWSDSEQSGLVEQLTKNDTNFDIAIEYLDCKRFPEGRHLADLSRLFKQKYGNSRLDLLVVMDNPALEFALDNRREVFRNVPIVFCGINNYRQAFLRGDRNITGIAEKLDPAETIELMLRLHPDTKEIVVPHDNTVTGLSVRKEVEALVPRFSNRTRFRFVDKISMEDLLKILETLPKDSLVFEQGFITDKNGHVFGLTETTQLFSKHSPVPVYGTFEQRLGSGMVGGKMLGGRMHGAYAARIALRILAEEKAAEIPVVTESVLQYMFDYQVMKRFGIPLSALPKNSTIINKPISFFAAHRNVILPGLAIIVFLSLLLGLLLVNIVQRRRSAIVLGESEERFRLIASNTPDHLLVQDRELRYSLVMNPQLGLTEKDMIGKTDHEFLSQDDADKLTAIKRQVLETGNPIQVEVPLLNSKGEQEFFNGSFIPKLNRLGQVDGLIGYFRNVTERKQAEEALRESEERYRIVIEQSNDGVCLVKGNWHIYVNQKMVELLGYNRPEELIGQPLDLMVHPDDLERVKDINRRRQNGEAVPQKYECKSQRKNGEPIYLEVSATNIIYRGETVTLAFLRDITDRKQAEDKILASLKEKEVMIQEIHHRVKNNLQVISGLLSLQARASKSPEVIEGFHESQDRIRAMGLVHEKIYDSKDFTRVDLSDYVRSLSEESFQSYNIRPGQIDLTIKTDGKIYVDISKAIPCGLILNELISNTLKHAFPGGRPGKLQIIISKTKETKMEMIVRDNGLGLPDDVDIYEPRSVGLYLVNGLTKNQLDGQIEVRRNNGTEFRIIFPL